jgi:predicted ATPase
MENSLHPHAIRSLIGSIREWCEDKDITVVLATHSPVVLDCFNQQKENIFVTQPGEEVQPVRLTDLGSADWLAAFSAGQIYADEEVGAPVPPSDPSKR